MAGGYPELVAPVVPNAQANKSPELLIEGFTKGLAGFAAFAKIRRDQEMEVLKLAADERIAQDQHAFEREKLYKDTEVQDDLNKAHMRLYDAQAEKARITGNAYVRGVEGMVNQDQVKSDFIQAFKDRADELKLNDPNFEKDDPAQFYLNARELQRQYGTSTVTGIPKAIGSYLTQAEQHRIQLPQIAYDGNGNAVPVGKVWPNVVVGQVVEGLHDPNTRKLWMDRLKAGGHIKQGKDLSSFWQKSYYEPDVPDATASGLLNKSDEANFGGSPAVIQPDLSKKARDFRAIPSPPSDVPVQNTDQPDASASPASSATPNTDALMRAAKDALRQGADPRAVSQRLSENGVDPSTLWG